MTTITAPAFPENPTSVFIVDYGRHASLVLPNNGTAVEFEYGEWNWFALGRSQSPRMIPALFWPTQGTLGRRQLNYAPDRQRLIADRLPEDVLSIQASSSAVTQLRERLTAHYEANLHTQVINQEYEMAFVQDPVRYTAFHNCNHELAAWLQELGCLIGGGVFFARFKMIPAGE